MQHGTQLPSIARADVIVVGSRNVSPGDVSSAVASTHVLFQSLQFAIR